VTAFNLYHLLDAAIAEPEEPAVEDLSKRMESSTMQQSDHPSTVSSGIGNEQVASVVPVLQR